jgi:hypothetical protein
MDVFEELVGLRGQGRKCALALFAVTALASVQSCLFSSRLSAQPIINSEQVWGPTSDGMRMAISAVSPGNAPHGAEFFVAFQNAGSKDVVLNLGFMDSNGKEQYPGAVQLTLTDSKAQAKGLRLMGPDVIFG